MSPAPLKDLPDPPVIPLDSPAMATPDQIMLDSRRVLRRRILAASWIPGLALLTLWGFLLFFYVLGTSPTLWTIGTLISLAEPSFFSSIVRQTGFDAGNLGISVVAVPLLGTLLSGALIPLSVHLVASMNPRMHLTEAGFQKSLARRAGFPLMIPPLLAIGAVILTTPVGLGPHWDDFHAGSLANLCMALLATLGCWAVVRRVLSARRLLDIPPAAEQLGIWDRSTRDIDPQERARRLGVLVAQDRRHLPPSPHRILPDAPELLQQTGRSLSSIASAALVPLGVTVLPLGGLVFAAMDAYVFFDRIASTASLTAPVVRSVLPWQVYALGLPLLGFLAVLVAFAPRVAMLMAHRTRDAVLDQRTYPRWDQRAQVNPWEVRVVTLTGILVGAITLATTGLLALLLEITGGMTVIGWVWIVLDGLLVAPLLGVASASAMRHRLRDVVYGPEGLYARRGTPYVLVAPDHVVIPVGPRVADSGSRPQDLYRAAAPGDAAFGRLPDFGGTRSGEDSGGDRGHRPDPGHRIPDGDADFRGL